MHQLPEEPQTAEMLRGLDDYRMLIYAIVLIVMMIFNQSPQMIAWRNRIAERFKGFRNKDSKKKGVA